MGELMGGWMDGRQDRMGGWIERLWMGGWIDGSVNGWMAGRMGRRLDG